MFGFKSRSNITVEMTSSELTHLRDKALSLGFQGMNHIEANGKVVVIDMTEVEWIQEI